MISSRKSNLWLLGTLSTLALGAGLAGCGGGTSTSENTASAPSETGTTPATTAPATGANKLTAAGSTFVYPIMAKWADTYHQAKGVQINYQSVGSGAGIKQLKNRTVDFAGSDAPLKDAELKEMPLDTVHIPVAAGAVVIAYNLPGVSTGLKLDGKTIADIYLGKIKKWNDPALTALNPGVKLPDTALAVAHRSDGSGTTYIFTNYLAAVSPEWKSKVGAGKSVDWPIGLGGKGNDGVTGVVKQAPGGFGYVELAYAKQNKLPYAVVKNSAGQFVTPSVASVTEAASGAAAALQKDIRVPIANSSGAKAYPISGFTYVLAYKKQKDAATGEALKSFLHWVNTDGQKMSSSLDYAPLPAGVVALNEKTIDSIQ